MSIYVVRAFTKTPPEASALQKALTRAQEGLAIASAAGAIPGDAAITPMLSKLFGELERFARAAALTPVDAAAVAQAGPDPPAPIEAPQPPEPPQAPPPRARSDRGTPSGPAGARARPKRAPPVANLNSADKNVKSIVAKLTALHERRANLLHDLLATWGALKAVDTQMIYAVQSLRWLGEQGLAGAQGALADAEDEAGRFAAVTALLQMGASDHVFAWLEETLASTSPGVLFAFRVCADLVVLERLLELGERTNGAWRVLVLAALAERGHCAPGALLALLDDPDDEVAIGATEIFAWVGRGAKLGEAVCRSARDASPARRSAILFADVALGSRESLFELRRVVDAGAPVTERAVDALAVAGEMEDADRLTRLAARQPELGPLAVLAAGHRGNLAATAAIAAAEVSAPLRAHALRTVQGLRLPPIHEPVGVRLLYGEPWTLARALERLTAPDEVLRARRWYALEVAVSSGTQVPTFFDAGASTDIQEAAAETLRAAVGGQRLVVREGSGPPGRR